jgi:hypothetical protein
MFEKIVIKTHGFFNGCVCLGEGEKRGERAWRAFSNRSVF